VAHPKESSPRPSVQSDTGPRWKPLGAHRASDLGIDIAKALTSPRGASARPSRAWTTIKRSRHCGHQREQDPKEPIQRRKQGATSSAALEHGNLMAQGE
jgi:hypothetical protein